MSGTSTRGDTKRREVDEANANLRSQEPDTRAIWRALFPEVLRKRLVEAIVEYWKKFESKESKESLMSSAEKIEERAFLGSSTAVEFFEKILDAMSLALKKNNSGLSAEELSASRQQQRVLVQRVIRHDALQNRSKRISPVNARLYWKKLAMLKPYAAYLEDHLNQYPEVWRQRLTNFVDILRRPEDVDCPVSPEDVSELNTIETLLRSIQRNHEEKRESISLDGSVTQHPSMLFIQRLDTLQKTDPARLDFLREELMNLYERFVQQPPQPTNSASVDQSCIGDSRKRQRQSSGSGLSSPRDRGRGPTPVKFDPSAYLEAGKQIQRSLQGSLNDLGQTVDHGRVRREYSAVPSRGRQPERLSRINAHGRAARLGAPFDRQLK